MAICTSLHKRPGGHHNTELHAAYMHQRAHLPAGRETTMEIPSQAFLFAPALLLPFSWLLLHLLSASAEKNKLNGWRRIPIPSPPGRPITGHLHLLKKPLHRSLAALARRHGGGTGLLALRFGARPVVLVSSPAVADECFTAHDAALADRPSLASRRLLTDDCPSVSTASYGPVWRHLRRLATVHALCAHRLAASAAARDAEARAMAAKLWRAGAGGAREVSVKAVAYEFVVNVIMAMVAGERLPEERVAQFKEMTEAGFTAAGAANRQDFLPALRMLDIFGKTRKKLVGLAMARHQFGQSLVDEYRRRHRPCNDDAADHQEPRTVIGDLLREQERSPESHDDVVIRNVCLSLLQAGTDTSSCTIEWAMALLLNHPTVFRKAVAEIDAVVGTSRLLQESDLADLPYLQCIVTETLRLYPLTPHLVPHEASRDCELSSGHVIERGTMVLVDVYSMQRDPDMWDYPEEFLPERFMGAKKDGDKKWMMPFGMGRRKCPGEGLALKTVGMALGVLIQCFEWERVGVEEVDMSEGSGLTMPMVVPLVAMCRPRVEMDTIFRTI